MQKPVKILVADDHPLFRSALKQAINQSIPAATIIECGSIPELEAIAGQNPDTDLILLDLHMPGAKGFSGLVLLRREFPNIPIVVVSDPETVRIQQRAMDYGAAGFIPKSSPVPIIADAIATVLAGELWLPQDTANEEARIDDTERDFAARLRSLTPQQFRILMLLGKGLLNKQIADQLNISEATVRTHMTAIFKKLGVYNRTQAVIAAAYLNVDDDNAVIKE